MIGPLGEKLTNTDLRPRDTSRWIVRRKAEVVSAVNGGLLSVHDGMSATDSRWKNSPSGSEQMIALAYKVSVSLASSITESFIAKGSNCVRNDARYKQAWQTLAVCLPIAGPRPFPPRRESGTVRGATALCHQEFGDLWHTSFHIHSSKLILSAPVS